jgi:aminoglycoside 6'-N-acetyltransferase
VLSEIPATQVHKNRRTTMIIFQNNEICLRSLEEQDADLLVKWLSDPTVLQYYEGRDRAHDKKLVQKHFYENRDETTQCIIRYQSHDIGYLQFYLIDEEEIEKYGYVDFNGKIFGMDQFIGEPSFWNQGIGTQLINETVRYLIDQKEAKKIVMDPQAWNTRALKVYEKCGFTKRKYLEKHEFHEGQYRDCWLIEYEEH